MAKAKSKKAKNVSSKTQTKSLFLHGTPNIEKLRKLAQLQTDYTEAENHFIELLFDNSEFLLQVLKNDKKDSAIRKFEKSNRAKKLGSAYSQNAFDDAVTILHNRMKNIRKDVLSATGSIFALSIILYHAVLMEHPKEAMIQTLAAIRDGYKDESKIDFYDALISKIAGMDDAMFQQETNEVRVLTKIVGDEYKIPLVKKAEVKLDTRLAVLERATETATSHVVRISIPQARGERVIIPVNASGDALRRMNQYDVSNSMRYTITEKRKLKLTCSFEKKPLGSTVHTKVIGVDVGIIDAIHTSDDVAIGCFDPVLDFYKQTVEPAFAELSDLRNKKKKLKAFLKKHKGLPEDVRLSLRRKMDHLEQNIREANAPYRKNRHYHQMLDHTIKDTVNSYIQQLNGDKSILTAMELLDNREFNKGRRLNGRLSLFARGKLTEKLQQELAWYGYAFQEVDPVYTSQVCPVCSNLDKASRKGKIFCCTACGHKDDADHVGGINIMARAADTEIQEICDKYKYREYDRHIALSELYAQRHELWKTNNAS